MKESIKACPFCNTIPELTKKDYWPNNETEVTLVTIQCIIARLS